MSVILQAAAAIPTSGPPSYSRRQTSHRISLPPGSPTTLRSTSPPSPPGHQPAAAASNLSEQQHRRRSSGAIKKRRTLTLDMTAATSCEFQAQALNRVQDYKGQCILEVSSVSISVKVAVPSDNTGETGSRRDLGTWPFDCIRRFNTQVGGMFTFTSGRRGPGGVKDYQFKLSNDDLMAIQQILNQRTGAVFDSPNRSSRVSSTSSIGSVPPSPAPTSSTFRTDSIDNRSPPTEHTSSPALRGRQYTPTPPPLSPDTRSSSPRASSATIHRTPTQSPPTSASPMGRSHSASHLQEHKVQSPLLQGKQTTGFNSDNQNPTYQHQFPLHTSSQSSFVITDSRLPSDSTTEKGQQSYTLLPHTSSRHHHHYEEAADVVTTKSEKKKSRKEKDKKTKKPSVVAEQVPQAGYDKLADVRPPLDVVPEERDRTRSDETEVFLRKQEQSANGTQRSKCLSEPIDPMKQVELRHKPQSPPPIVESDMSSLDTGTRNWTKKEIKQVKKLQRETLINSSPVTHERRGAQYTEIILPSDSGSNLSSRNSTSSENDPANLYATPSSIPATDFVDGNATYDIPTTANPNGLSVSDRQATRTPSPVDQALISRSPSPNLPTSIYSVPRPVVSPTQKKTPPHKPLPHLPDEYENITLRQSQILPPVDDQVYMNINGQQQPEEDVYSEIPAHLQKPTSAIHSSAITRQPSDQSIQLCDLYTQPSQAAACNMSAAASKELAMKSETLARELASSGYEFVSPAKTPPLMSPKQTTPPPNTGSNPLTDEYIVMQGGAIASPPPPKSPPVASSSDVDLENEYIVVQKPSLSEVPTGPGGSYVNTPPRSRRGRDGYDEVDSGTILMNQKLQSPQSARFRSHDHEYENASVVLAQREGGQQKALSEPNKFVHSSEPKQLRKNDGYEEVDPYVARYSPPKTRAQSTDSASSISTTAHRHQSEGAALSLPSAATGSSRQLEKQVSADIGDMVEADVLEEGLVPVNGVEDEYMVMQPQRQHSSSSTDETLSSPPPTHTNGSKSTPIKVPIKVYVPTAKGSPAVEIPEKRKRSLTTGSALDSPTNVSKKHTYENINEPVFVPHSPPQAESILSKKPMPLPRPAGVCLKHPAKKFSPPQYKGSESPKFSRAKSKTVFSQTPAETVTVRRTNSH